MSTVLTLFASFLIFVASTPAEAQSISERTADLDTQQGFVTLHWDADEGALLLQIHRLGEDFLYLRSLATGVGSNRLGLDRGEIGSEFIGRFERVGPKVHFVLQNPGFRAHRNRTEALVRSVEESFPTSTVASWEVMAADGDAVLVDATDYFLQDAFGVAADLRRAGQGTFRVDADRSRIHLPRTKAFPENTEVEAALTFAGEDPGSEVRRHTPDGRSLTLRQHHSFVQLPDDGYEPRTFDPRIGLFSVSFFDYGKAFDEEYVTRFAVRHRLRKRNPGDPMSEPVEPIVYYLDPAVPEPYRSAFIEGGEWWSEVFEAAGYIDAFQIRDMPDDMDPMDARYHVMQWVHRTEAGSSIGPSFVDPRTGEIIKAAVRMDSHRSLADYNLYAGVVPATEGSRGGAGGRTPGLVSPAEGEHLSWIASLDPDVSAEAFTMARRRQHSAHEIGHTLGLAHNFIAASYGRASVMDYPAPLIELEDGAISLDRAYRDGPGAYDSLAIRWAYTEFPDGEETAGLEAIIQEGMERDLEFITNSDERSSSSHPDATTWINGSDVLDEMERVTEVRRFLVQRFGEEAIEVGEPMWRLQERFVPVYLHHRFQLGAVVKNVGGMEFRYGVRGDPLPVTEIVDGERQRRALRQLAGALAPGELAVPESVLRSLAPRPFGYADVRVAFESRAAPAFDQLGIARTLARMVVGGVLEPERMARVAAFHQRDPSLPSPEEVVSTFVDALWEDPSDDPLARVAQRELVDGLIDLAADADASVEARAAAEWGLRSIRTAAVTTVEAPGSSASMVSHAQLAAADIQRFLQRRHEGLERTEALEPPPGTPIGSGHGPRR
ncbi:MAG: zinc-dependent metalloprotease [Longimicrobiales bacterium]|nr:zinc-dependent metalloprotease [Longimicrobiales bacterium]